MSGDLNHTHMKGHSPAGLRLLEVVTTRQIPVPYRSSTRASGESPQAQRLGLAAGVLIQFGGVNCGLTVVGLASRPGHRATLAGFWPQEAA